MPTNPPIIGREYPSVEENIVISKMISDLEGQLEKLYTDGEITKRQAHPKMHGCVKAEFIIEPNLPENLQVGLFKEAKTFPAWIRFSNASSHPKDDSKKDVRGVAIKLMDVPGEKVLVGEKYDLTHDFNLISSPTFISKTPKEFQKLLSSLTKGKLSLLLYFLNPLHWGTLARTLKSLINCNHVLDIPYWSTTPYQFGDNSRAVKYHFRPQKSTPSQYVADKTIPDYLRLNLINALADSDNEIYYDFCIQFQENAITMPIEDPTVNWESPFIKVATVRFLAQDFDTDEQNKFGENLSFTPWHCLPEHIPIGGMNRVREKIYECLSKFRHDQNDEPLQEPTSDEVENLNSKTEIMNQKNEQVVKNLFHCYATQNMAGVMALMSTDIQWTEPGAPDVPFGGVYKGHAGITEMLEKEGKMLKVQNFTPTTFFSNENMVIVLGYDTTLVNETQKTYYTDWTMAYTINENELISKVQTYMDTNAIAKAFIKDEIVA